ncbi:MULTISPECIES: hypothetical protein [unclassified Oscillibacter]|uniref:hypothetical protein n=1 Tax=unclassified Oscillibacter TaxID=2629304 RepID=UPI0025E7541D|nr:MULTISPECIES: hypothetical protein [unclassified Oscillibacter]
MENENMNPAEETSETTDAFLDGWDPDGIEDSETSEAEALESNTEEPPASESQEPAQEQAPEKSGTPEETTSEKPEEPEEPPATAPEIPKTWTLRHLGEEKAVNEQEMTTLAQKGLDYDRVREKYDAAKPVMEMFAQMAKQSGMTVEEYVSFVRTEAKKSAGMNADEAKRAVDLEDRESAVLAKEAEEAEKQTAAQQAAQAEGSAEERRNADIAEFQKTFPDAAKDAGSIPQEVWDAVKQGQRLAVAYALWREKQALAETERVKQESAAKEQNAKNAGRSTGSMKTAGAESKASDSFLDGFGS